MSGMQQQSHRSSNGRYSYTYVEGEEYTNENYQLLVKNIPNCIPPMINDLERTLHTMNARPRKFTTLQGLQPRRHDHDVRVHFSSEEQRQHALEAINKHPWKKGWAQVRAEFIDANTDPFERSMLKWRNSSNFPEELTGPYSDPTLPPTRIGRDKRGTIGAKEQLDFKSLDDAIKHSIVPLWNVPYDRQVKGKEDEAREILRKMKDGASAKFLGVISDQNKIKGYRRNVTLTIGKHENQRTVGFLAEGTFKVAPIPADLINMPGEMKQVFKTFEEYVRKSQLDVYDPEDNTGYWEAVTVQFSDNLDELMIIAKIPNLSKKDRKNIVKPELLNFFTQGEGSRKFAQNSICKIASFYLQIEESWKVKPFFFPIIGEGKIINRTFRNLQLQVSKRAFFRENAELVFKGLRCVADLNKYTDVLELGCGIGTIGMALAQDVNFVYGVENCSISLNDAEKNKVLNGIQNCEYFSGPKERNFSFLPKSGRNDLVAIIDTLRFDLVPDQVETLRLLGGLKKVVLLSCNTTASSLMETYSNFFCPSSATLPTNPFVPFKAVAVDSLPHTEKFDFIICFERASSGGAKREFPESESTDSKRGKYEGPPSDGVWCEREVRIL